MIVNVVVAVMAPVTANVLPLKLKFPSAVIAELPVPVSTALSVNVLAPVPPSATVKSVIPVIVPLVIVTAPLNDAVPSTINHSLILIEDESPVNKDVPVIFISDDCIELVPLPNKIAVEVCEPVPVPPSATGTSVPPAL